MVKYVVLFGVWTEILKYCLGKLWLQRVIAVEKLCVDFLSNILKPSSLNLATKLITCNIRRRRKFFCEYQTHF
jgi:hypothetical protein